MNGDPLSDVLSLLQIRSGTPVRMLAGGDWSLRFPAYDYLKVIAVPKGRLWVQVEGSPPCWLEAGDCLLMRSARSYVTASAPRLVPLDGPAHFAALAMQDGCFAWGGAATLEMVAGRFDYDRAQQPLLEALLPPLLHLKGESPAASLLRQLLELFRHQSSADAPGQRVVAAGMARMALVQALRADVGLGADGRAGWLAALGDAQIGAALRRLHGDPSRRWTVSGLAAEVGMSRSSLALRFKQMLGVAPLQYLQQWRMQLAQRALVDDEVAVGTLAYRLGYASESAFSAAFKRHTGLAPAHYRQSRAHPAG